MPGKKSNLKSDLGILALVLLMALALTGCGGGKNTVDAANTYTIADPTGDWGLPSPYGHYQRGPGYLRMSFVFDTLVWKDSEQFVPALAQSWNYNKDDNSYIFKLHRDVTWHDGEKFDARDVLFTFNYTKKFPYAWSDTSKIKTVETPDPYTVIVKLKEPYAPFMDMIACTLPVLPEHIWKQTDKPEEFTEPGATVGTGPFKLVDYNKEHGTYLYEANESYYGGQPLIKNIRFVKVGKEMTSAALKKGEVNAAAVPPETIEELRNSGLQVITGPHFENAKLMVNHRKEPLSQKEFRQALAYAIDRNQLVQIVKRGHGVAASPGMLPKDSPWYNPSVEQYPYNPEMSKKILEQQGYVLKDGYYTKEGRVLNMELLANPDYSREAELIAKQLIKVGIKIDTRSMESKTLDRRVENWEFDLAINGHGGLGGDPEQLNRLILGKGFNSTRFSANQKLNRLLSEQLRETDLTARKKMVQEAQKIYADELPALSLYYPTSYWAHDGSIPLFYTKGGVALGVPLPLNKMSFVK